MNKNSLKTNSKLNGQCFLKNRQLSQKFVNVFNNIENEYEIENIVQHDTIIEVGFGNGSLTDYIFKNKNFNKYIGYDIDKKMSQMNLITKFKEGSFLIKNFLTENVENNIKELNPNNKKISIISNLPFSITQAFLIKICHLSLKNNINNITVGLQEEVGKNITKLNKAIFVLVNFLFNIKKEFLINKKEFVPSPKVNCFVITLIPKNNKDLNDLFTNNIELIYSFLKQLFQSKKKKIKNLNLKNIIDKTFHEKRITELNKNEILNLIINYLKTNKTL